MNDSNEDHGIVEEAKKALTEDAEVPIDKKVAGSTFSLVALSYMTVLVGGAILLSLIMWALGVFSEPEVDEPVQSPLASFSLMFAGAMINAIEDNAIGERLGTKRLLP